MWILCRNLTYGEVRTCQLTRKMIVYGDYYYQDSEDSRKYIKASEYHRYLKEEKYRAFDRSNLERAQSEREYTQMMIRAEQEFLAATILNDEVIKNGEVQQGSINGLPLIDNTQ